MLYDLGCGYCIDCWGVVVGWWFGGVVGYDYYCCVVICGVDVVGDVVVLLCVGYGVCVVVLLCLMGVMDDGCVD